MQSDSHLAPRLLSNGSESEASTGWWNNPQASGWERIKEAFRRDWEQTKADLSSDAGHELHQDVVDTLKQAAGSDPLPLPNEKSHPAPRDIAGAQSEIAAEERKLQERIRDIRDELLQQQVRASEEAGKEKAKVQEELARRQTQAADRIAQLAEAVDRAIAEAQETADQEIIDATEASNFRLAKARAWAAAERTAAEEAGVAWQHLEREASFGVAARAQYPHFETWTSELETLLAGEWANVRGGRPWDLARGGIRRGWAFAAPPVRGAAVQ